MDGFDLFQWCKLYTPGGAGLSLVDDEDLVRHIAVQMLEVSMSCQHSFVCVSRDAELCCAHARTKFGSTS